MTIPRCSSCLQLVYGRVLRHQSSNWCESCYTGRFGRLPLTPEEAAAAREAAARAQRDAVAALAPTGARISVEDVILTTAPQLEGYRVVKTLEIVTAECVFGMNIFRDVLAGFTDVFGGRSDATQAVLRDARKTCLAELRAEALAVGGNAAIAVDLDYSEMSGQGKAMLFLVASGTAVQVEPITVRPTNPPG